MCGRYSLTKPPEESVVIFTDGAPVSLLPRYNVAPSQWMPVIPMQDPKHVYYYRWGLIPHWAKEEKIGFKMLNARAETLLEKPAFRGPMRTQRCLVPADGFYEWKQTEGGKQPYRIILREKDLFYFAGLYDSWQGPNGKLIGSYTIITTEPNELMIDIHDRMPVILPKEMTRRWLDPDEKPEYLHAALQPYSAAAMRAYPVSPAVGNVRNDTASLIEPYAPPPSLFG